MRLQRLAQAVSRLYRRLDLDSRRFQLHSGLRCLPACGRCCLSADVEATVLEMLPAALHLAQVGRLESHRDRLGRQPEARECVLYRGEPPAAAPGHCGLYAHRPLVCRLFGFSAVLDREGRREVVGCRLIRQEQAEASARAAEEVRGGAVAIPMVGEYRMRLYGIDPTLGSRPLPINAALAQALEMVALRRRPWLRRAG